MGTKNKAEDPLRRDDYLDYWLQEARYHFRELSLPTDHLVEVIAILIGAFGRSWLENEARKVPRRFLRHDPSRNRIGNLVSTPSIVGVVELVELATYLKHLGSIPHINTVVRLLKQPESHASAMLQIAFAYRFSGAGVCNLEFEPTAERGRFADIKFQIANQHYLVECYSPKRPPELHGTWITERLAGDMLELEEGNCRQVLIHLCVSQPELLTASSPRKIVGHTKALLRRYAGAELTEAGDGYEVTICDARYLPPGKKGTEIGITLRAGFDIEYVILQDSVLKTDIRKSQRGLPIPKKAGNRLVISAPTTAYSERDMIHNIRKLVDKIEKKVTQVRPADGNACGVILVDHSIGRPDDEDSLRALTKVVEGKILRGHSDMAGVLVTNRELSSNHRPYYCGTFVENLLDGGTTDLFERIVRAEINRDILKEW
jgi:hypothetical protein